MNATPSLQRILPAWVEPDPLKGRAIDALGLQATADRIAERVVPGLSVLTTRARYFAMLAWARRACGTRHDEHRIHRLEVALAVREAAVHRGDSNPGDGHGQRCRFVGSRYLGSAMLTSPPKDPRLVYKQPVWRAYRASMQNLGLLDGDYALTPEGTALAKRFAGSCHPKDASGNTMLPQAACLSKLSAAEAKLLSARLGVHRRGKLAEDDLSPGARRCATERELHCLFDGGLSLTRVLSHYEGVRKLEPSRTVAALREAAVWERLSVGLHAAFLLFLKYIRTPATARVMLQKGRSRKRGACPAPADIAIADDDAGDRAIASVRRALALRTRLGGDGALPYSDATAFDLGEALAGGTTSIDEVFERLATRHFAAKGDDAWIRPRGRGLELARDPGDTWTLPPKATLHGYRLGAFGQILFDLRRATKGTL